ncbi:MAG: hypothetical protein JOY81_13060 [Alphaproteobacteria bacterium]|nr:hypothetical protein [Alphaproteobacteria bacterium]
MRYFIILVFGSLALAACGRTPHPFEHDDDGEQIYAAKRDKVEVAIAPPTNMPAELGQRVAAALAVELQAYNIVAVVQPQPAPVTVQGTMSTRDSPGGSGIEIEIDWTVAGKTADEAEISKTQARPEDYAEANDRLVSRIAQQAAPKISTLLGHPPAYEARSLGQVMLGLNIPPAVVGPTPAGPPLPGQPAGPADTATKVAAAEAAAKAAATPAAASAPAGPQVRVMVAPVTGAPSDGNRQLFSGMRRALGSNKIIVADRGGGDVFVVACTVSLTPIDNATAQLSVVWTLRDPSGKDVGKVEQSNPVPVAATRGTWAGFGDIVADAAVEGIITLINKVLSKQP